MNNAFRQVITDEMNRRMGPGHDKLKEFIIPKWSPGCRRISPGDGYLEALVQPNVEPVYGGIEKIVKEGVVGEDGTLHKIDILVCATGFNVAFRPRFRLINGAGKTLDQDWDALSTGGVNLYLGTSAPRFPNYHVIVVSATLEGQWRLLLTGTTGSGCDMELWDIAALDRDDYRVRGQDDEEDPAREHPLHQRQAGGT